VRKYIFTALHGVQLKSETRHMAGFMALHFYIYIYIYIYNLHVTVGVENHLLQLSDILHFKRIETLVNHTPSFLRHFPYNFFLRQLSTKEILCMKP